MSGRQFQLDNPIDVQGKVATLRQLAGQQELQQMQIQQARQTQDQERTLADLYKGNVGPDGTINRQGMFTAAAERGLGAKIPAMQKQFAEADKATAAVVNPMTLRKSRRDVPEFSASLLLKNSSIGGDSANSFFCCSWNSGLLCSSGNPFQYFFDIDITYINS